MRFNCKYLWQIIVALLILFTASGCESDAEMQQREFIQLETALNAISTTEDPDWEDKLRHVETLTIEHPRIREVQTLCVSAYKQYADGMKRLNESERYIKTLETALSNKDISNIENKHQIAKRAVEETTFHLKQAEQFIGLCVETRQHLQRKLKVIVK